MDEAYEALVPVSVKERDFLSLMSVTTKWYVSWLSFVFNGTFNDVSQIEVLCFPLQYTVSEFHTAHALWREIYFVGYTCEPPFK